MNRSNRALSRWSTLRLSIAIALLVVTAFAFQRAADCQFVNFDDGEYVADNPHVLGGPSPANIWWALTATEASNWHPLTWISLQLDAAFFGNRPGGYHATNVFLHLANTVLLFLVLERMTGALGRSAVVAALFGLHPLHVESVAWIVERKDVLSALFWILTMAAYLRFIENPGLRRYILMAVLFALGLMAKPMLVTLPGVLLLLDYWPLGLWGDGVKFDAAGKEQGRRGSSSFVKLLIQKLPLFALSLASAAITIYAQTRSHALKSMMEFPLASRIANAAYAYVFYIAKIFWPARLSVFYPYDRQRDLLWSGGAAGILVVVTVGAVVLRRRRYLLVGWFWYLVTLFPVIGIVQVGLQAVADRYTYIPLIGLFIALVWGIADFFAVFRVPVWIQVGVAAAVLAACGFATHAQMVTWRDSETLWTQALRADPDNEFAHRSLGSFYLREGKDQKAIGEYKTAVEMDPADAQAHFGLGFLAAKQGRFDEAIHEYREAIRLKPDVAEWHENLAVDLLRTGKSQEAIEQLLDVVRLKPAEARAHYLLGQELGKLGRKEESQLHLEEAYRLTPSLRDRLSPR
jgi:tetratricopeptide (TPR) repeat protein